MMKLTKTLARLLFTLGLLIFLYLNIASCSVVQKTAYVTNSPTMQQNTRTPTPYLHSTSTDTPPPTRTQTPSATPDIRPNLYTTIGKGLLGSIGRSPDGSLVALMEGKYLRWFDSRSGEEIGSVLIDNWTYSIIISPNNRWILVETVFSAVIVDTTSGTNVNCCGSEEGTGSGRGFSFSDDSRYIAFTVTDRTTGGPYYSVEVYDIQAQKNIETQSDAQRATQTTKDIWAETNKSYPVLHPSNYHTMTAPAISPDDRWLAAGYHDRSYTVLYVWDLLTGVIHFAINQIADINSVDFSPDGRLLASGGDDGLLRLYDVRTGNLDRIITGFSDSINHVTFSDTGQQIIISVSNQPDKVFDLLSNKFEPLIASQATPDPILISMHHEGYSDSDGVLFSPDGKQLAIGSTSIQLWDLNTISVTNSLENPYGQLLGWDFSPDGTKLAGITANGDVLVWNTETGDLYLSLDSQMLIAGQVYYLSGSGGIGPGIGGGVYSGVGLAFSPDGTRLAFGNGNGIEIWDVITATKLISLVQPTAPAYATRVSFSTDGNQLYAIINRNRLAQVWDVRKGSLIKQLDLPFVDPNAFTATALNGSLMARNNYDDNGYWVELWNLDTGRMYKLPTISRGTEPLQFSPDGKILIAFNGYSYNGTKTLYFWNTDNGQLIYTMDLDVSLPGLAINPNNTIMAVGQNGKAQLWDISAMINASKSIGYLPPTQRPLPTSEFPADTPFPTQAVTFTEPSALPTGAISPSNVDKLIEMGEFGRGTIDDVIWSSNPGNNVLTAGSQGVFVYGGYPIDETESMGTSAWMKSITENSVGDVLAGGVISQSVQVLNVTTGANLVNLPGESPVELNSTGDLLAYGDGAGNLKIFDIKAGQPITTLNTLYEAYHPVFSPDSSLIAAVNGYGTDSSASQFIRIWETRSGRIVNAQGGPDALISDLSFSRDGKFLVGAAGGSAWIWDVELLGTRPYSLTLYTSELKRNQVLYHQRVTAAAMNNDNQILAIGDSERNIWIYNIESRGLLYRLQGHTSTIQHLSFSPKGSSLLSTDVDGNIVIWDISTGLQIARISAQSSPIHGLLFGIDGNLHAWEANTAWVLQSPAGELIHSTSIYSGTIFSASPDGKWLAVSNRLYMTVWDAHTGQFRQRLDAKIAELFVDYHWEGVIQPEFYKAGFTSDSTSLSISSPGETWTYSIDSNNQFQLVNHTEWWYAQVIDERSEPAATSSDGQLIVKASQRWGPPNYLLLTDKDGQGLNRMLLSENSYITSLTFNADARLIAIGQADGSIQLLDVGSWKIITEWTGHKAAVTNLTFSADGTILVSGSDDGTIRFWGLSK